MANEFEQAIVLRVTAQGVDRITTVADELKRAGVAAESAVSGVSALGGALAQTGSGAEQAAGGVSVLNQALAGLGSGPATMISELQGQINAIAPAAEKMSEVLRAGAVVSESAMEGLLGELTALQAKYGDVLAASEAYTLQQRQQVAAMLDVATAARAQYLATAAKGFGYMPGALAAVEGTVAMDATVAATERENVALTHATGMAANFAKAMADGERITTAAVIEAQRALQLATRSQLEMTEAQRASLALAQEQVAMAAAYAKELRVQQIETQAQTNLELGRARGLRGILIGLGASWAAELLLVVVAAEQVYRALKKFDDWVSATDTSAEGWSETWRGAILKVRDGFFDAIAQMISKQAELTAPGLSGPGAGAGVALATKYGLNPAELQVPSGDVQASARFGATIKTIDLGPLIEDAKKYTQQAELAFDDSMLRKYSAALRAAGGEGTAAGQAIMSSMGPQVAAALQAAIDKAKELTSALAAADAAALAGGYETQRMIQERANALGRSLEGAQGAGTFDVLAQQSKGAVQKILDDFTLLGKDLPPLVQQAVAQLGLEPTMDKEGEAAGKAIMAEMTKEIDAGIAVMKQRFDSARIIEGAQEKFAHLFDGLRNPDLSPLEQALKHVDDIVSTEGRRLSDSLGVAFEKIAEGRKKLTDPSLDAGQVAKIQAEIAGYQRLIVIQNDELSQLKAIATEERAALGQQFEAKALKDFDKEITTATLGIDKFAAEWRDKTAALPQFLAAPIDAEITKIAANATNLIQGIIDEFKALDAEGNIGRVLADPQQMDEFKKQIADVLATLPAVGKELLQPAIKDANEIVRILQQGMKELENDFSAIFEGAVTGGFKGIEQALGSIFKQLAGEFGKNLGQQVLIAFGASPEGEFGKLGAGKGGTPLSQEAIDQITAATAQRQALLKAGAMAISGIMQAATQEMSDFQAGLSAVVTGVSVGLALAGTTLAAAAPYVAVIVAAAVFVAHLLQSAAAAAKLPGLDLSLKYTPGSVAGTVATGNASGELTADQVNQILRAAAQTANSFVNAYIQILMKFPQQLADLLAQSNIGVRLGGTNFPQSADFQAQVNAWIEQGLPGMIEAAFWHPISVALQTIGFGADKIKEIGIAANQMDPKAAVAYISSLVDAALGIKTELSRLLEASGLNPKDIHASTSFGFGRPTLLQDYQESKDFFAQQAAGDASIQKLWSGVNTLTGQAQVDQVNKIVALMDQRYQKEIAFIGQISNAIDSINKSFSAAIRANELSLIVDKTGKPDVKGQIDFLNQYLKSLEGQLATTKDPAKVQQLGADILATIEQIKNLGVSLGGVNIKHFTEWAITAEEAAQKALTDHLKAIGKQLDDANKQLYDAIQGFIKTFLGATNALGGGRNPIVTPNPTPNPRDVVPIGIGGGPIRRGTPGYPHGYTPGIQFDYWSPTAEQGGAGAPSSTSARLIEAALKEIEDNRKTLAAKSDERLSNIHAVIQAASEAAKQGNTTVAAKLDTAVTLLTEIAQTLKAGEHFSVDPVRVQVEVADRGSSGGSFRDTVIAKRVQRSNGVI